MCDACLSDNKIKTTTTFTVECNGCLIIIKNVPCLECECCGEIIFTDEVSEKLENLISKAKLVMQDVSVIDYTKAA